MKTVRTLLVLVALLVAALVVFIYSGLYDVAASTPDGGLVRWALGTTQGRSVHRRAEGIAVPRLDDPAMIRRGLVHYHAMCVTCHGAPGVALSEIGQGLNPEPPELAGEAGEEPAELFWVTKHGIKMTGMPAFGATHDDEEIWAIVAFLQELPRLSPERYQALVRSANLEPAGAAAAEASPEGAHHHEHPPGTPAHDD
jgi:mono/diheme cytochrome c family protein